MFSGPTVLADMTDISVLQVGFCLEAADKLAAEGISAEVINLRCIRPLDRDAIVKSIKKTNRHVHYSVFVSAETSVWSPREIICSCYTQTKCL